MSETKNISVTDLINNTLVKDVMSHPIKTVVLDDKVSEVEEIFVANGIRHLPVVDYSGKIVGLITQRDLYKVLAPRKFIDKAIEYRKDIVIDGDGYYVKEVLDMYILEHIMHKDVETLTKEATLAQANHLMVAHKRGCVPIIDENKKPVGMLTRMDILRLIERICQVA